MNTPTLQKSAAQPFLSTGIIRQSSRPNDTVIEVYRPVAWNPKYVSWNNRAKGIAWTNAGGDWYDKNGVSGQYTIRYINPERQQFPDNKYYELNVTDLVKEYVSGKYETRVSL